MHAASLFDVPSLLEGAGPWVLGVVALIVFVESGLLFPFLPGDSLLFTAGLLHEPLHIPLPVLIGVIFLAAVLGDQAGYLIGERFGRRLFTPDARILKTAYLDRAEQFFERHGGKALVMARFVPIVRTYVPLVAGMTRYRYRRFLPWNVAGGLLWAVLITLLGVWLGGVPFVADNIDVISVAIVVLSVIPIVVHVWLDNRRAARDPDDPDRGPRRDHDRRPPRPGPETLLS